MKYLVWASLFLVLAIVGSGLGAAKLIGMPITASAGGIFGAATSALVMWSIFLFARQPRLVSTQMRPSVVRR